MMSRLKMLGRVVRQISLSAVVALAAEAAWSAEFEPIATPATWHAGPVQHDAKAADDLGDDCDACCDLVHPGWYLSAEYLAWELRGRGFDYAIPTDGTADYVGSGDVQNLEFDRDSGYRMALGYITKTGWEVAARYTYFNTNSSASAVAPVDGNLWATRSHPAENEEAQTADASGGLELKLYDFEFGRWIEVNRFTALRVVGGLRWLESDQQFQVLYDGNDFDNGLVRQTKTDSGLGVRFGAEMHWSLAWGFSPFVRGVGTVLSSRSNTTAFESDNSGAAVLVNIADNYYDAVTNLDAAIGLAWNRGHWHASGGYEVSQWMNFGNRTTFDDQHLGSYTPTSPDLLLEGFFARLMYTH